MGKGSSILKGIGTFFIMVITMGVVKTCTKEMFRSSSKSSNEYRTTQTLYDKPTILQSNNKIKSKVSEVPEDWSTYTIDNNAFTISIPKSKLELRHDSDRYTKLLKENGFSCNTDVVVFQQIGLGKREKGSTDIYGRVMIAHYKGKVGDYLNSSETEPIDADLKKLFEEMVHNELGPYKLIRTPSYEWLYINDIRAVEIRYKREGNAGNTTSCTMYLLFNSSEMVKMIVSFHEEESNYWLPDMENIIMTFRWE